MSFSFKNQYCAGRDFKCFHTKLSGLTSVTRTFLENLVKALEDGLSDENSHVPANRNASSKSLGRSYSGKKGREEPINPYQMIVELMDEDGNWKCEACSYDNVQGVCIVGILSEKLELMREVYDLLLMPSSRKRLKDFGCPGKLGPLSPHVLTSERFRAEQDSGSMLYASTSDSCATFK
ncbi:hypothetical protein K1719_011197 [Acacia pycnantha]|nr:hypothetical protein K1719_011197 [Acacia pycnantha]